MRPIEEVARCVVQQYPLALLIVLMSAGTSLSQQAGWGFLPSGDQGPFLRFGDPVFKVDWNNVKSDFDARYTELPFDWSRGNFPFPVDKQLTAGYRSQGARLWLTELIGLGNSLALNLEGAYLLPSTSHDSSWSFDSRLSDTFPYVLGWQPATRTEWWLVDGQVRYNVQGGAYKLLAGLRSDKFDSRFTDFPFVSLALLPAGAGFVNALTPDMRSDVTVTTWIPYVGVELRSLTGGFDFSAQLIAAPWISPRLKDGLTAGGWSAGGTPPGTGSSVSDRYEISTSAKSGYLYEMTAQCAFLSAGFGKFGLFAKGTWMRASFRGSIDFHTTRITPSGPDPGAAFPLPSVAYTRRGIALGGSYSLAFVSPM